MNTAAWSQYNVSKIMLFAGITTKLIDLTQASSYLSSLIAKQTNSPSQPFQDIAGYKIVSHQVDIGSLLKTDLSLSNDCSLTESRFLSSFVIYRLTSSPDCELIKCQDVRGNTPGEKPPGLHRAQEALFEYNANTLDRGRIQSRTLSCIQFLCKLEQSIIPILESYNNSERRRIKQSRCFC